MSHDDGYFEMDSGSYQAPSRSWTATAAGVAVIAGVTGLAGLGVGAGVGYGAFQVSKSDQRTVPVSAALKPGACVKMVTAKNTTYYLQVNSAMKSSSNTFSTGIEGSVLYSIVNQAAAQGGVGFTSTLANLELDVLPIGNAPCTTGVDANYYGYIRQCGCLGYQSCNTTCQGNQGATTIVTASCCPATKMQYAPGSGVHWEVMNAGKSQSAISFYVFLLFYSFIHRSYYQTLIFSFTQAGFSADGRGESPQAHRTPNFRTRLLSVLVLPRVCTG
jgi:hypothetical protein